MQKKDKNKRREFLALGIIAGAGALAGSNFNKIISERGRDKIRLITSSGEVVEVEARHLPEGIRKKPVSNETLKKWMEGEDG